jgi:hypothetical protein
MWRLAIGVRLGNIPNLQEMKLSKAGKIHLSQWSSFWGVLHFMYLLMGHNKSIIFLKYLEGGLVLLFSQLLIVTSVTPIISATSFCNRPRSRRFFLRWSPIESASGG